MKKIITWSLVLMVGIGAFSSSSNLNSAASPGSQTDASIQEFWEKFSAAVIKGDKIAVAGHTRFPVSMPYGMAAVRNKAQLTKRYRSVFNGESDAAKCFATAKPVTDPANSKLFTVGCKSAAGDEVVIYSFARTAAGWKFVGLDNLNE